MAEEITDKKLNGYEALIEKLFAMDKEAFEDLSHALGKALLTKKFQKINTEENTFKYWHATLHELGHVRKWGRIGTKGQTKEFPAESNLQAEEEFDKILRKKIREGYEEVFSKPEEEKK